MRRAALLSALLLAACSHGAGDPCAGATDACVTLSVTSSQIHGSVDALALVATGAVTANKTTTATHGAKLPFKVALHFGAGESGMVHLAVTASASSLPLGEGSTDFSVPATGHTTASVDLEPLGGDGGMGDLPPGGDAGSGDMMPVDCDPHSFTATACVWRWQAPYPVGEDLRSVHSFADGDIFALTYSGAILHFDGTTWSLLPARPTPGSGALSALKLVGGTQDLYILGSNSVMGQSEVFHSKDKGASWFEEVLPNLAAANSNIRDIEVVPGFTDDIVVAVGGFAHIVTRSSAGVWTDDQLTCVGMSVCSTNFRAVTASNLDQVAFYSATGGYVGPGTMWTSLTGLSGTDLVNALCSGHDSGNSNIRYWGVGYNGVIASASQAAPTSWSLQANPTSANLNGCAAADQNKVWAFGANGTLVASTNGGTSWVAQKTGSTETLLSGSHGPGTTLTVVGTGGVILQALDGMPFSNMQTGVRGFFSAIQGVAPYNLYAVGGGGAIARTTDGVSWTAVAKTGTTEHLLSTWGSSATDVYAVGAKGTLVHTTDGSTFTRYANPGMGGIPATANLFSIAGLSANNVLVGSDLGLYRSVDGGKSFSPVAVSNFMGTNVYTVFALGGDVWIGGDSGQIYHSTDGTTWSSQTLGGAGAGLRVTSITGGASGELFAASVDDSWLARSLNKGASWTNGAVTSLNGSTVNQIALTPSGSSLYALSNELLVSTDHGMNFVPVNTAPVPAELGALFVASDSNIYGASANGLVHFGN